MKKKRVVRKDSFIRVWNKYIEKMFLKKGRKK